MVVVDPASGDAWLLVPGNADIRLVSEQADAALLELAPDSNGFHAIVVIRAADRERERVRFVSVQRIERQDRRIGMQVTLEWAGREHAASAVGEKGDAIELRTVATATLDALSELFPPDLHVRLAGIKAVRAFDAELVVVSLYRTSGPSQSYVGTVVAGGDPTRAAAAAVLAALNRVLGNYLVRS